MLLRRFISTRASRILSSLDIPISGPIPGVYNGHWQGSDEPLTSVCPATGETLAVILSASPADLATTISKSREAYRVFRNIPAPKRGEILSQIREALTAKVGASSEPEQLFTMIQKHELGQLVSLEMGKIKTEGVGEVQEFIDICDYGIGLSRAMNGRVIASERPGHSILEVPNPLGVVAVLSAFNFPVAVYGWNLALSLVAGNATLWKPSPTTPLCSIAIIKIISGVLERNNLPGAIASLVTGGKDAGEAVVESNLVDMVSFTGSEDVGRRVAKVVQSRFGKVLLELGGNNASIVMPDADLSMAVPGVFFGAVGTAGQRCTTTRRLFLHRSIADQFLEQLLSLYAKVNIGDPLLADTLLGPLHSQAALNIYDTALKSLRDSGEIITEAGRHTPASSELRAGNFVLPVISIPRSADPSQELWRTEVFVPILNVAIFDDLEEAIEWNNAVPQGLSSSLWTRDIRHVGKWIGPTGSDAGIVNVNVGTSGAEISAGFGGNKNTGWGREAGGDSWKQYVRWSACTLNFSDTAPLAQGVTFNV